MQHVQGVQKMAYYSVQHDPVEKRIVAAGDIGTSRHFVGLSVVPDQVPILVRTCSNKTYA